MCVCVCACMQACVCVYLCVCDASVCDASACDASVCDASVRACVSIHKFNIVNVFYIFVIKEKLKNYVHREQNQKLIDTLNLVIKSLVFEPFQ